MASLPKKMRAVVFSSANGPLHLTEKQLPIPEPGELLVKIKAVSICASDFVPWKGYLGDVDGLVPGHEGVGVIVGINGNISGFSIGDRIGFSNTTRTCQNCDPCQVGQGQFCSAGVKNQGFNIDGYFAEYAVVSPKFSVRIPDELPLERLAPLFCAGVTAFRAVKQVDAPARGKLGVFGLGGVGLFVVRFAMSLGFDVIGFDVSAASREQAKHVGLSRVLDSSNMVAVTEEVHKLTSGRLLDAAIVTAGVAVAYDAAVKLTGVFKTIVAVGIPRDPIQIDPLSLIRKGLVIKGTQTGAATDLKEMMRIVQQHQIIPEVELGALEDIPELFARSTSGKSTGKLGAVIS